MQSSATNATVWRERQDALRDCKIQFWFCATRKIFSLIFILDAKFTLIVRVNMVPAAISLFPLLENVLVNQRFPRSLIRGCHSNVLLLQTSSLTMPVLGAMCLESIWVQIHGEAAGQRVSIQMFAGLIQGIAFRVLIQVINPKDKLCYA